jgi:hypothetical protein
VSSKKRAESAAWAQMGWTYKRIKIFEKKERKIEHKLSR